MARKRTFSEMTKATARAILELPHDKKIVLSVGRCRVEKNLRVFVEAAKLDKDNLYVLVGDGPQLPALKHMATGWPGTSTGV